MYLSVGANCHVACMQMSQCVTKVWISVWHDVQVSGWLFCILCVKCSWNVGNRNYNHPLFDRAWTRVCVCVCMSDRKWMNKCVLIVEPWRLSGRLIKESFIYAASAVARSLSLSRSLALALSQQNAASLQHHCSILQSHTWMLIRRRTKPVSCWRCTRAEPRRRTQRAAIEAHKQ